MKPLDIKLGDPWPFQSARGITGDPIKPAWFALITPPQKEARTAGILGNAMVTVRYPKRDIVRHIRGKKHVFTRPEIPSIIYARFKYSPRWDVMKSRQLIIGVFSREQRPIELSQDDVDCVMGLQTEAERLEQERIKALTPLVGEKAQLIEGPFEGFLVDVERVEAGRIWWSYVDGLRIRGEADLTTIKRVVG